LDQKSLSASSQELVNTFTSCDHLAGPTISRCNSHDSLASFMVGDFNEELRGASGIPSRTPCSSESGLRQPQLSQVRSVTVSKVVPRRRPGQSLNEERAVCITAETVERLSGTMSLAKASDVLGISSTAMKKACRRLGITRWRPSTHADSVLPPQIDSAYVRRIRRKHLASMSKSAQQQAAPTPAEETSPGDFGGPAEEAQPCSSACETPPEECILVESFYHDDQHCEESALSASVPVSAAGRDLAVTLCEDTAGSTLLAISSGAGDAVTRSSCGGTGDMWDALSWPGDALLLSQADWCQQGHENDEGLGLDASMPMWDVADGWPK